MLRLAACAAGCSEKTAKATIAATTSAGQRIRLSPAMPNAARKTAPSAIARGRSPMPRGGRHAHTKRSGAIINTCVERGPGPMLALPKIHTRGKNMCSHSPRPRMRSPRNNVAIHRCNCATLRVPMKNTRNAAAP